MKKIIFVFIVLSFSLIQLMLAKNVQQHQWNDGTPFFSKIDSSENVLIDSVITLTPLFGVASQNSNFQFILSGMDWTWPEDVNVESAEDIDYRNFLGSDLYLVTDGAGNKVVEINAATSQILWEFKSDRVEDPKYLGNPVDAYSYTEVEGVETVRKILITDQGRHRVLKVIKETGDIQWQYGTTDVEGNGFNQLSNPVDAIPLPDSGEVFICDKGNNRIILVNEADTSIIWSWGIGELNNPVDIEYSYQTQEILITDQSNHRVIKVDRNTNAITWQFGRKGIPDSLNNGLNMPTDADLLSNRNILICDAGNSRLIEVNQSGQIVWEFGHSLQNLKDADRLPDNKHLVITDNLPMRLGYTTAEFISQPRDIGYEVSFISLFWEADTLPNITSVRLQLRSENTLGDLESAPWRGPGDADSFYVQPATKINPAHNGHRFYQFKAKLITNDPLYTPVLKDVQLTYYYYDVDKTGKVVTQTITDSVDYIITRWKTLNYNTKLPENPASRDKVELKITIKDAITNEPIRSFVASNVDTTNEVALSNIEGLKQKQAIKLQATFNTNNSSVSPTLNYWTVDWDRTYSAPSDIHFVDQGLRPVSYYRFSDRIQQGQPYIDRVTVFLNDLNMEQIQDIVSVTVIALNSLDQEQISLNRQGSGGYLLQPSIPGIILSTGIPAVNNGFFEVFDRDTLVMTYTDPTNPNDQSQDSVLIIENTSGIIQFEDQNFVPIDSATVGDTVFVRVKYENDRNITFQQDTVTVIVFDHKTNDEELITLFEVQDSTGSYNTGEFLSPQGLQIELNNTSTNGDGKIQTISGSTIGVKYFDTISQSPILQIITGAAAPDTTWNFGGGPLDFDFAPNPFYEDKHSILRIRASSSIGTLVINKIEIYTLAGVKINEIDGSQLSFYYNYPIPVNQYGFADNWWNLKNKNGDQISSGTYFIKVYGKILETNKELSEIKKLVILR